MRHFFLLFLLSAQNLFPLWHSSKQSVHGKDPFPPDYLDRMATFVASLSSPKRTLFHSINNDPTLSESQRIAKLNEFVAKLPNETKAFGMALLDQMCQLGSVFPGQPFMHYVAVFLQLMAALDEERREKAIQIIGEQQTDAEFEQKFVEFALGFENGAQKLMAIEMLKAKHAIREQLLERLKMAKTSQAVTAKKAKLKLKQILQNLDMPQWEICWRLKELEQIKLRREDRDQLLYVLTMLKVKC